MEKLIKTWRESRGSDESSDKVRFAALIRAENIDNMCISFGFISQRLLTSSVLFSTAVAEAGGVCVCRSGAGESVEGRGGAAAGARRAQEVESQTARVLQSVLRRARNGRLRFRHKGVVSFAVSFLLWQWQ